MPECWWAHVGVYAQAPWRQAARPCAAPGERRRPSQRSPPAPAAACPPAGLRARNTRSVISSHSTALLYGLGRCYHPQLPAPPSMRHTSLLVPVVALTAAACMHSVTVTCPSERCKGAAHTFAGRWMTAGPRMAAGRRLAAGCCCLFRLDQGPGFPLHLLRLASICPGRRSRRRRRRRRLGGIRRLRLPGCRLVLLCWPLRGVAGLCLG